ncbi:hypothetical protein [Alteromonas sp. MB-3u-76]|uniref:hypothetical protein n=1 Tax=Alteromonas sp. MB-3u-76 TaxID=2058133 RepID=UPI0018E267A9|nr:hypothetical protein [Alteromonas sp. MB-3u-76]
MAEPYVYSTMVVPISAPRCRLSPAMVNNVRGFAHPSDSTQNRMSVQSAINLAISLVNNELKHNAALHYEPGDDCYVNGNLTELSQVFVNLLVNAVKAIEENGVIDIDIEETSNTIQVRVKTTAAEFPLKISTSCLNRFSRQKKLAPVPG